MNKILILADIHGNLSALEKILEIERLLEFDGVILLGDMIDYGPRSNEVVKRVKETLGSKILVNIWGNHEWAVLCKDYSRFSSERGKQCAAYTRSNLNHDTLSYLNEQMEKAGKKEFDLFGKKCLAVHGSLHDNFWKSISHEEIGNEYAGYDFVFSGHSHIPHFFEHYYPCDNKAYRYKKKTVFINPGSVGQPRNHNPGAHYAVLEIEPFSIQIKTAEYDIAYEVSLFSDKIDKFYKERLKIGV